MANKAIRTRLKTKAVKQWQVAEKLGMWESHFSVLLRHELPDEEQQRIISAIDELAAESDGGGFLENCDRHESEKEGTERVKAETAEEFAERLHSAISNRGCADVRDVINGVLEELIGRK